MKKIVFIMALFSAFMPSAFAQEARSPSLFWVGGDFGWNGTSFGGGANVDVGMAVAKNLYVDLVGAFFLADTTSLLFGAGVKYVPTENGVVAGLDLGVGDIQKNGVDGWCLGWTGMIGYDFGWIVLGTKINLYIINGVQATYGLFVELT